MSEKKQFISKWSNWWSMSRDGKALTEAFAKELDDIIISSRSASPHPYSAEAVNQVIQDKDSIINALNHAITVQKEYFEKLIGDVVEHEASKTNAIKVEMGKLLERASWLVGNPGTNISGSTDIACDNWHIDYKAFKSKT